MGRFVFFCFMALGVLAMAVWMAIGAWPVEWVRWRAEHGDQMAIKEMFGRLTHGRSDNPVYWADKMRKVSGDELIFWSEQERKIMLLLGEAGGTPYRGPLLDIINEYNRP